MSAPNIKSETPLSLAEVNAEVEKVKKRDDELSFRTQRVEEYLQHFANKDALKLQQSLTKMEIPRLKEEHIAKIVDLMPKTVEDLKSILSAYTVTVTKDNMKKIVDEVAKVI